MKIDDITEEILRSRAEFENDINSTPHWCRDLLQVKLNNINRLCELIQRGHRVQRYSTIEDGLALCGESGIRVIDRNGIEVERTIEIQS